LSRLSSSIKNLISKYLLIYLKIKPMGKDKDQNFLLDFTMAGIAACVSKTTCAPLERVKLIMQTQHNNK